MESITDLHIEQIAELESLLKHEMFSMRQSFLVEKYGFNWIGRKEIVDLEKKQLSDRNKFFNMIKSNYTNINPILFLQDYAHNYNLESIFIKINKYSNLSTLTSLKKKEYDIYYKFKESFNFYYTKYDKYSLKNLTDELEKIRNKINVNFKKKNNECNIYECSICIDDDEKSNCVLDCKHQFHKLCIETWLKMYNTCPLCRASNIELFDIEISYEVKISYV